MQNDEREQLASKIDWNWFFSNILGESFGKPDSRGNIMIHCISPGHVEKKPSMSLNIYKGLCTCYSCGYSCDFIQIMQCKLMKSFKEVMSMLNGNTIQVPSYINGNNGKSKYTEEEKILQCTAEDVLNWHRNLISNNVLKEIVNKYGISDEIINLFKIGIIKDIYYDDCYRMTIPVNDGKKLIAVRKHRVTGDPKYKTISEKGSSTFIYPYNNIVRNKLLLMLEGEPDVLCAYSVGLDKFYTPCTITGGCNSMNSYMADYFKGKLVLIAFDNDEPGLEGKLKTAMLLHDAGATVKLTNHPQKTNDLRNYFVKHAGDLQTYVEYINKAEDYDETHRFYIRSKIYPLLQRFSGDIWRWKGLRHELDAYFLK